MEAFYDAACSMQHAAVQVDETRSKPTLILRRYLLENIIWYPVYKICFHGKRPAEWDEDEDEDEDRDIRLMERSRFASMISRRLMVILLHR